jgi:hypothetical protein
MELDGKKQLKAIHHIKGQRDADNEGLTPTAVRPFCITAAHGATEVAHRTKVLVLPTVRSSTGTSTGISLLPGTATPSLPGTWWQYW